MYGLYNIETSFTSFHFRNKRLFFSNTFSQILLR